MARNDVQSLTALPRSPLDDRRGRMRKYSIAMSIRTVCLVCVVVVPDWWRLVFGIGAVILPYIAVVLANVGATGAVVPVAPGAAMPLELETAETQQRHAAGAGTGHANAGAGGGGRRPQAQRAGAAAP